MSEIINFLVSHKVECQDTGFPRRYSRMEVSQSMGRLTTWIQAINQRGLGPQSHAISIKTLDDVPPSAPSVKVQSSTATSITLAWSLLNNFISTANQYSLFYRKLAPIAPSSLLLASSNDRTTNESSGQQQMMSLQMDHTTSQVPFTERTLTSKQLILAGNLFLGADQDSLAGVMYPQSGGGSTSIGIHQHHQHPNGLVQMQLQQQQQQQQHYQQFVYTLDQLECGSVYELYMSTRNSVDKSEPSATVTTRTSGEPPLPPSNKNSFFSRIGPSEVLLNLASWSTGGCPLTQMSIQYKNPSSLQPVASPRASGDPSHPIVINHQQQQSSSNNSTISVNLSASMLAAINGANAAMTGNGLLSNSHHSQASMLQAAPVFTLKNLLPSACYELEILAQNSAGFTKAQYDFVTSSLNDSRSGYSRKEGIYRVDQRGQLIDSLPDEQQANSFYNQRSSADGSMSSFGNNNQQGGGGNFHHHLQTSSSDGAQQVAPLIFLFLCLVFFTISSTFCYFRFRGSWKSRQRRTTGSPPDLAPSSFESSCHPGPGSSVFSQSSPGSIDKSSMWRLNKSQLPANSGRILNSNHHHHHLLDPPSDSPVHYCMRDPSSSRLKTGGGVGPASSNPTGAFVQSVSMRDFNLIGSNNNNSLHGGTLLKSRAGNQVMHHPHHARTLNLKSLSQQRNELASQRMLTLRNRLPTTGTPYDDLLQAPNSSLPFSHLAGQELSSCPNGSGALGQKIASQCNSQPNEQLDYYQNSNQLAPPDVPSSFVYDLTTEVSNVNDNRDANNCGLLSNNHDCGQHQHQQETSWTLAANYAIPSNANSLESANNHEHQLAPNGQLYRPNQPDQLGYQQSADCDGQTSIDMCIQQLLDQEYQQQQQQQHHYALLVEQQQQQQAQKIHQMSNEEMPYNYHAISGQSPDGSGNLSSNHRTTSQTNCGNKLNTGSVLESSSGSSSSGIDMACQQSDIGSSSTFTGIAQASGCEPQLAGLRNPSGLTGQTVDVVCSNSS